MGLKRWYDAHVMPRLITCAAPGRIERPPRNRTVGSGRVLELGCGGGLNQQFYETAGLALAGIDPHEKLLEGARARHRRMDGTWT